MSDQKRTVAQWLAEMKDGISGPAQQAAKALDELKSQMEADRGELAQMQKAMRELKRGGGKEVEDQMKALKLRIDQKQSSLANAQAKYLQLGGSMDKAKRSGGGMRDVLKELQKGVQSAPGPLGRMMGSLTTLIGGMTKAKLLAIGLATAFVAVAAAGAVFATKMTEAAIAAQDARRNEMLHLEALTKMRNIWGFAAGKASDMQAAVDKVSSSVSIARGDVAGIATELYRAGLRGKNFETVLEASAIKASALGSAAGSAFAGFATAVHLAGGSAQRAAQDIKNRFGGVVQAKMKSLEVQTLKQKEAFDSLFSGINIEPYLTQLKMLRDMFSQNTASGRALHSIMSLMVQPLVNAATDGITIMRRFFKQMLIGAQEIIIAWLTVRVWFKRTFGGPETDSIWKKFFGAIQWGRFLVYILAAAFGALAISVAISTWPILLAGAALLGFASIVQNLFDLWNEIDWTGLGTDLMEGLIGGIKKYWGKLKTLISDTGESMKTWFKTKLGISSPSKAFMQLGLEIPAGLKQGIERGTPAAQAASASIITPQVKLPTQPAAAAKPSAAAGKRGDVTLTIAELHVHAGSAEAKELAQSVRRELESVLAGLAVQIGAGAPA